MTGPPSALNGATDNPPAGGGPGPRRWAQPALQGLFGLAILASLAATFLPPSPGFVRTGGPWVLARWLFGGGNVVDHSPLAFAALETAAWAAGAVVLLRSAHAGRGFVALAWVVAYHGATTLLAIPGLLVVVWGLPAAVVGAAAAHGVTRSTPVRVGVEAAVGALPHATAFGVSVAFAMQFWPPAAALLPLAAGLGAASVVAAVRRPAWRPWVLAPVLMLVPLSGVLGTLMAEGVFFTDDRPVDLDPARCDAERSSAPPGVRWLDASVHRPYSLFALPSTGRDERLLAVGERSARLIQVAPDGSVRSSHEPAWAGRCETPEALAIDDAKGMGWLACSGVEYIRFDLQRPDDALFVTWPPEGHEPLDVVVDGDHLRLTYSFPAVVDEVRFDGASFQRRRLHNYRGLVGSLPRFEDGADWRPGFLVTTAGLRALGADLTPGRALTSSAMVTSAAVVPDGVVAAGLRGDALLHRGPADGQWERWPVPDGPRYLAVSPERVFAAPYFGDAVVAMTHGGEPAGRWAVGPRPRSLRWSVEHQRLYGIALCGVFSVEPSE